MRRRPPFPLRAAPTRSSTRRLRLAPRRAPRPARARILLAPASSAAGRARAPATETRPPARPPARPGPARPAGPPRRGSGPSPTRALSSPRPRGGSRPASPKSAARRRGAGADRASGRGPLWSIALTLRSRRNTLENFAAPRAALGARVARCERAGRCGGATADRALRGSGLLGFRPAPLYWPPSTARVPVLEGSGPRL